MADDRRSSGGKTGAKPGAKPSPGAAAEAADQATSTSTAKAQATSPSPAATLPPVAPFAAAGDDEWESELAAWDAAIPIVTRATVVPDPSDAYVAVDLSGVAPQEENDFFETPTTVVSQAQVLDLDDLPEMIPAGDFDEGIAPASGSYAALITTDSSAPGMFEREPLREEPPTFPTDTLREMFAAPWTEDIRRLITLGDSTAPAAPGRAYLETLARVIADERALAGDRERTVALALGAARVADLLGDPKEAEEHVDAALAADGSSPAVHRARLLHSERLGRMDDAAAAESLAKLALMSHPDQAYYRSLQAEWILARAARGVVDGTAAAIITAAPDGLPRLLAEAELTWQQPAVAAPILETAAHRIGGGLGAAMLVCAAGLNEIAQDFQSAAEQRFIAARLDDQRAPAAAGLIRDLARMEASAVVPALEDLLPRFPPSPLKVALARWGASAARRSGDLERAWRFVADPARIAPSSAFAGAGATTPGSLSDSMSAALARDRLDLVPVPAAAVGAGAGAGVGVGVGTGAGVGAGVGVGSSDTSHATAEIDGMLGRVAATWSTPTARVCLALRACELAVDAAGIAFALGAVEKIVAEVPDAVVLGPAVEALAWRTAEAPTRLRALRLWRRIDPARWTSASLDLADALRGDSDARAPHVEGTESTWSLLNEIAAADVTSPAFWRLAAGAARRGDFVAAAGHIDRGLARSGWRAGRLGGPLAELGAELTARTDVAGAAARLGALRAQATEAPAPGARLVLTRVLRRLGDRELWAAHVEGQTGGTRPPDSEPDRHRRASLLLESVFWRASDKADDKAGEGADDRVRNARAASVAAAFDLVSLHPVALGLALGEGAQADAGTLIERLVAGARGPGGERWTVAAAMAAAVAGETARALSLASGAVRALRGDGAPDRDAGEDRQVRSEAAPLVAAVGLVVRRLAWAAPDPEQRGRILRELASAGAPVGADVLVEAAEAEEALGNAAEAVRLYERAEMAPGGDSVATDVRAALDRLSAAKGPAASPHPVADGKTAAVVGKAGRLGSLEDAARSGRWTDVVALLVDAPPHEEIAGARILSLAAEIDEARAGGARFREILARARTAEDAPVTPAYAAAQGQTGAGSEPGIWLRIGDQKDANSTEVGVALERLADVAARAADERSAALLLIEAARLGTGFGGIEASVLIDDIPAPTGPSDVERRLATAVAHDPASAPAAMAWRRWLIRSGRITEAAQASAAEAEALIDPTLRVRALLRAAAMLAPSAVVEVPETAAAPGDAVGEWVGRAAGFLRRALEIAPQDHEIFTRLRELYEEAGRHSDLAGLLGMRLGTTSNPFEVTALHLARAEIFAGPLGDRKRAKGELEAILQKEPQHARALARLADVEQEDGNYAGAADLLIRRAFIERSPEKLRDLFLRLGRIYVGRVPDPKRALGAYSRVLQLDANNREALDELSKLYLGLGETKNAIAITERLVRIETAPQRRAAYHIRLGHLAERALDPRAAAQSFRRAVDEAPRDLEALGELARYLEKTRDTAGRRALLDHAGADLRAAVLADPTQKSLLDALVAVSRWRGRTVSAAAAAELGTLVASLRPDPGRDARLPDWAAPPPAGRRLAALTKPSVDEQTFPNTVPPSVRQLFRLLGPTLWEGGRSDLSRLGIDRADRVAPGRSPRDIFDVVAGDLAAGPFEVYVVPARSESGPAPLHVEPGKPPVILIGASLLKLGPHALRFAAGRTLRLVSTHLDMALAGGAADLGAWLGGIIRQFIGDYRHPGVPADITAARAARVAKLLSRKQRQEVMPFAMESSAALDLVALHAGIRDGANRIGLCASGSLGAALRVILTASGPAGTSADAITRNPEALALVSFALSDEHDELVRSLE